MTTQRVPEIGPLGPQEATMRRWPQGVNGGFRLWVPGPTPETVRQCASRFKRLLAVQIQLAGIILAVAVLAPAAPGAAPEPPIRQGIFNGFANKDDQARSVAVDPQGNLVASGFTQNGSAGTEFTVAKFNPAGAPIWQRMLGETDQGDTFESAEAVAVDRQGNVVAAGFTTNGATTGGDPNIDLTVVKYGPNGALLWKRTLDGTARQGDDARAVAVDGQGNVIAAGAARNNGTGLDFTVVKFDPNGTQLWQKSLNGTANQDDRALSVAVDGEGNVVAAGFSVNTGANNSSSTKEFTVAKFGPDGTSLWQRNLVGTASGDDIASSVAVDSQGNVVAAGITTNTGASSGDTTVDFTVAKYGSDGAPHWHRLLKGTASGGGTALSVTLDREDNVIAAGAITNTDTGQDLAVVKYNPDGTSLWERTINGSANGDDFAASVAVDSQGIVAVAGLTTDAGTGQGFTVATFNGDGVPLWKRVVRGTASGVTQAASVAMDGQGNILTAGVMTNTGSLEDFAVVRFQRDALPLWEHAVKGTTTVSDEARSVVVDRRGNVAVAGVTTGAGSPSEFTVSQFAPDGALLWESSLSRTSSGFGQAASVAFSEGRVVAAGSTGITGSGSNFTVAKFDLDGSVLWQRSLKGTANGVDAARAVAVDEQGNVFVVGGTENIGTGVDFTVAMWGPNGDFRWKRTLNGSANGFELAVAVTIDGQGNVVAAGRLSNLTTGSDIAVAKFSPTGQLLWQSTLDSPAHGSDEAFSVAVDGQGNALIAGSTQTGQISSGFTVAKFAAADGRLVWERVLQGAGNGFDTAVSVAVDAQGNAIAAGLLRNADTGADFTVAKFGPDGDPFWHRLLNGTANSEDAASSVTVDGQGNIVAAGFLTNTGTGEDLTVAKFNPDGAPVWERVLNGTANGDDLASAVVVDSQGNAIAAGFTTNVSPGRDYTVVKFGR